MPLTSYIPVNPPQKEQATPEDQPTSWYPTIPIQDRPRSSAISHIIRKDQVTRPQQDQKVDTPLLQAIRSALRGTDAQPPTAILTHWFQDENNPDGRELTWNGKNVILSVGGVMVKRWSYYHIKEEVQIACLGLLEQSAVEAQKYFTPSPAEGSVAEDETPYPSKPPEHSERSTFGPFAQSNFQRRKFSDEKKTVSAVFVFLRSFTKIYLQNGVEYTINIPFVARHAWPLTPHGVLVQRVLEPFELEEAAITGDPVLPTLFTITSPFQEPSAVGNADRIDGSLRVHTEAADILTSIPPTEMVLHATHLKDHKPLIVTADIKRHTVSVWVYAPAGDSFQAQDVPAVLSQVKARQSHGRRTSSAFEGERLDNKHTISAGPSSALPPTQEVNEDGFPVLPPTATFSSVTSVPGTRHQIPPAPVAIDERMRADYWMECIFEIKVAEQRCVSRAWYCSSTHYASAQRPGKPCRPQYSTSGTMAKSTDHASQFAAGMSIPCIFWTSCTTTRPIGMSHNTTEVTLASPSHPWNRRGRGFGTFWS